MLNSSGMAPSGETVAFMNANGYKYDPQQQRVRARACRCAGILTVTVPGSVWGWQEVLDKYGTMKFKAGAAAGRRICQQRLSGVRAHRASTGTCPRPWCPVNGSLAGCCTALDPDSVKAWYTDGKPPVAGQIFRNPDLAKAFKIAAGRGRDVFYKGEIAKAIVAKAKSLGGTMTMEDLADFKGEWVEPVTQRLSRLYPDGDAAAVARAGPPTRC